MKNSLKADIESYDDNKTSTNKGKIIIIVSVLFIILLIIMNACSNSPDDTIDENNNQKEKTKNLAYACARNVASKLNISSKCSSFVEVADGFYNYTCSNIVIRIFINNDSMTYDVYNSSIGTYLFSNYCYNDYSNNSKSSSSSRGNNSSRNSSSSVGQDNSSSTTNSSSTSTTNNSSTNTTNNSSSTTNSSSINNNYTEPQTIDSSNTETQSTPTKKDCPTDFSVSKEHNTYNSKEDLTIFDETYRHSDCTYRFFINDELRNIGSNLWVDLEIGDNVFYLELYNEYDEKTCKKVTIKRFEYDPDIPFTRLGLFEVEDCNN